MRFTVNDSVTLAYFNMSYTTLLAFAGCVSGPLNMYIHTFTSYSTPILSPSYALINISQVSSISGSSSEDDEDVAAQPRHRTPQSTFVKEGEIHHRIGMWDQS